MSGWEDVDMPGPSTAPDDTEDFLCSEASRLCLRDALVYYEQILTQNNLIVLTPSEVITEEGMLLAEDLFRHTIRTLHEKKFVTDEELIMNNEVDEENAFETPVSDSEDSEKSEPDPENYEPEEKRLKPYTDNIPLDYKIKVINIVRAHPGWSLKTLQKHGCSRLKRLDEISRWEKNVKSGGTEADKHAVIDSWTYDRFQEARQNDQQVTTRNLQLWALAAASQFENFHFRASDLWVQKFKSKHQIRQRRITKFVTERETATRTEILASAADFRILARHIIPNFHPDFVINTDQTGCQYQSTFDRTLAAKGSKVVVVKKENMNQITHSYTAQYAITLSGKLLPLVFVCLQETTDSFGRRDEKSVNEYMKKYKNVVVVSSKSGKLNAKLYREFLINALQPYVKKEKFLLLIDSWEGQTDTVMYNEVFRDDMRLPTCTVQVMPPKCDPLVQPCDVYFYRQVKNFIKRLQNCAYLIEQGREIDDNEDCVKIHSIVHHQLSSPIFENMIRYAWFASKLCDKREIFMNVNEVCFPLDVVKKKCDCRNPAFVQCARCRRYYCFCCFYDANHCGSCNTPAP